MPVAPQDLQILEGTGDAAKKIRSLGCGEL